MRPSCWDQHMGWQASYHIMRPSCWEQHMGWVCLAMARFSYINKLAVAGKNTLYWTRKNDL